jgi:hypothetical protein
VRAIHTPLIRATNQGRRKVVNDPLNQTLSERY